MSQTISDVALRLRFGGDLSERPAYANIGEGLSLRIEARDSETGAAIPATGVRLAVTRPDRVQLVWTDADMAAAGTGVWVANVQADVAGTWRFRATCDGPNPAARETTATVVGTAAAPLPPAPALTTQDLAPIVTQAGGALTVARVPSLPEATDPAGLDLVGVQAGLAKHVRWDLLDQHATAAGAEGGRDYADAGDLATLSSAMSYADAAVSAFGVPSTRFGTKGDNLADDTQALKDFFAYMGQAGGIGFIPPGRYRTTVQIYVPPNAKPYRVYGAGEGVTVIIRDAPVNASLLALDTPTDVHLEGFTLDAQSHVHTPGANNHCLSVKNGTRVRVRKLEANNHHACSLLAWVTDYGIYKHVVFEDCYSDGDTTGSGHIAQNGMLIEGYSESGLENCRQINCRGNPGIGLQLKNTGEDNWIRNGYAKNCQNGVALGCDFISPTGWAQTNVQISNIIVRDCDVGANFFRANGVQVDGLLIDHGNQGLWAFGFGDGTTQVHATNVVVLDPIYFKSAVRVRNNGAAPAPSNNTVDITYMRSDSGGTGKPLVAIFDPGAANNRVIVRNADLAAAPTAVSQLVTDTSGNATNSVEYRPLGLSYQPQVPTVINGGTIDGAVIGGTAAAAGTFTTASVNGAAGTTRDLVWKTGGTPRWIMRANNAAETGGNVGSSFNFLARDDAGNILAQVFGVSRDTQIVAFDQTPTAPTPAAADNTTKLATTAWVRSWTHTPPGTGAVARTVQSRLDEAGVSLRSFGAVGDGTTSDQTALAAFFAHLKANGGVGVIPPGTYVQTAAINIFDGAKPFKVIGAGRDLVTIKRAANVGTPFDIRRTHDLTFEGITFDAGNAEFPTNSNHGLSVLDCHRVRFIRCRVRNYLNTSILYYVTVQNTYEGGVYDDLEVDGLGVANNGAYFEGMDRCVMRGVRAKGCPGNPGYGLQFKNNCRWGSIDDCYAEACSAGVAFGQTTGATTGGTYYTRVNGVTVKDCGNAVITGYGSNDIIEGLFIDMGGAGGNAVELQNSVGISVVGMTVMNVAANQAAVRFNNAQDCVADIAVADLPVASSFFASFRPGSTRNTLRIGRVVGLSPDTPLATSRLTDGSGGLADNRVEYGGNVWTASTGATSTIGTLAKAAGTGAVARLVQSKMFDQLHVRDFGATGDGTTNDQPAIQAAITAAAAAQVPLLFDRLTYKVSQRLLASTSVTILGRGATLVPTTASLTNGNVLEVLPAAAGTVIDNLTIDGGGLSVCCFRFDAPSGLLRNCAAGNLSVPNTAPPGHGAFYLSGCNRARMEGCRAYDIYQTGGQSSRGRGLSTSAADGIVVDGFRATNVALGWVDSATNTAFQNFYIETNADNPIYLVPGSVSPTVMNGVIRPVEEIVVVSGVTNATISGVTVLDPPQQAFLRYENVDGLRISDCRQVFSSTAVRDASTCSFFVVRNGLNTTGSRNLRMDNCYMEIGAALWGVGSAFWGRDGVVEDWTIRNCHLRFFVPAGSATTAAYMFAENAANTARFELSDNTFELVVLDTGATNYVVELEMPGASLVSGAAHNNRFIGRHAGTGTATARLRGTQNDKVSFSGPGIVATNASNFVTLTNRPPKSVFAFQPPTQGAWIAGDRIMHSNPSVGQPTGWICTGAGTPGTWTAMANL